MTASSGNIGAPFQVRVSRPAERMPTVAECRTAEGERDVAERDQGEERREEQPAEAERDDADDEHDQAAGIISTTMMIASTTKATIASRQDRRRRARAGCTGS